MPDHVLDIFSDDAFSVASLTNYINEQKFLPGRVGQLVQFTPMPVDVRVVEIESQAGGLALIQTAPVDSPPPMLENTKRSLRNFRIPHIPKGATVMASEVAGVRRFGSSTDLETVIGKVNQKIDRLARDQAVTLERLRLGAIKGTILDADGSTIYNLFTEFGISQYTEIDFDLDNATPASGALRKLCSTVLRQMADAAEDMVFTNVHALCGNAFFDDLIAHKEVRETYLNQVEASQLRGGMTYGSTFRFGDITWENYRGGIGGTPFIDTNKCHIFATGAPDLYFNYFAPANYIETVNLPGRPLNAKQERMRFDVGVEIQTQSNPLPLCLRPKTLMLGKRT